MGLKRRDSFKSLTLLLLNYESLASFQVFRKLDPSRARAATAAAGALLRMHHVSTAGVPPQLRNREKVGYVDGISKHTLGLDFSHFL